MNKCICNTCGNEVVEEEMLKIFLEGTQDVYTLSVCNDCYDLYGNEYFEPYQVDIIF